MFLSTTSLSRLWYVKGASYAQWPWWVRIWMFSGQMMVCQPYEAALPIPEEFWVGAFLVPPRVP